MRQWASLVYNNVHRTMHREADSRKARRAIHALGVVTCLASAGCVVLPETAQQGLRPAKAPGDATRRDGEAYGLPVSRKPVSGKEAPTTLFAVDGTRCTVTKKKFDQTKDGDRVLCAWRKG
jgi:hypothetical protein